MSKFIKLFYFLGIVSLLCVRSAYANTEDDSALETYNRAMFNFNTVADDYLVKPVAKGYRAITTEFIRERVHDFFENLKEPASMINHTLQGDFSDSGNSLGRFAINSTLGLLGTFDVASGWGLTKNKTGFDRTLASWCVPDGPFIVLPLLGPSTPRATVGMAADTLSNPTYWADYYTHFGDKWEGYAFYYGITALGFVSVREENLELLDNLTANSVDPYATVKAAYIQNRLKIKACAAPDEEQTENSYDFDFDEEFDE
ncbi:MAG: VacJ family lipoprotein [Alphaproteobacteria bacterium]|nr:VacJ family lipoprotein [Alphaproteobacteria bacterium]